MTSTEPLTTHRDPASPGFGLAGGSAATAATAAPAPEGDGTAGSPITPTGSRIVKVVPTPISL